MMENTNDSVTPVLPVTPATSVADSVLPVTPGTSVVEATPLNVGSTTAKNGYLEEDWIISQFAGASAPSPFESSFMSWYGLPISNESATHVYGHKKCDFRYGPLGFQWKRTKQGQFGQIARHEVNRMLKAIPALEPLCDLFHTMCVFPLEGNRVVQPVIRPLLTPEFVHQTKLDEFITLLTTHKRTLLEYALLGTNPNMKPDLFGITIYEQGKRHSIQVWRTSVLLDYLAQYSVRIRASGTVVEIGKAFTFQRKGGDSGATSSNQLQFKLVSTKIPVELGFRYVLRDTT